MVNVKVKLEKRSYNIHIDVSASNLIGNFMQTMKVNKKILVISDTTVGNLYGRQMVELLVKDGYAAELCCVSTGEHSKSVDMAMELYTKAITLKLDRNCAIIALGGGVIGDLSGFVAATYLRGVPFIQIPTSLLAQVDSSVGGKVAVNHPMGKNLIGAFYQPRMVLIDINFLSTLPNRELYTGLAEVIKYGMIADKEFFTYLCDHYQQILDKRPEVLTEIVRRSCEIKAWVVEQDECESSIRAILNFGHTIGHAIEADTNFSRYNHGEAVAIGMYGAALISKHLNMCSQATVDILKHILLQFNLPVSAPECGIDDLFKLLYRDKKVLDNKITWVLLNEIGEVKLCNQVPENIVKLALAEITQSNTPF
ncbi:3-dehydroquinate synthase [Pelosinus propionicus]|uniref:3-dehydroquinate synthase n=1 Tax=Pelosinus propionicus DSM 13327 TaxID=1123291 RepID=A0A1I4HCU4_9FIRM|nr:3-dehydroquinate synthase [Pelosinus propionicus]SFL40109.1 3-dehydroquinate synthase [Pelosinus propionicus DSM 13327]